MRMRQGGRDQQGQAMVEFVIVAPILLLLVFGIIQFGIYFNNQVALTDAVRAGARQAAVSRTLPDPTGTASSRVIRAAGHLDESDLEITVVPFDPRRRASVGAGRQHDRHGDLSVLHQPARLRREVRRMSSQTTERVE